MDTCHALVETHIALANKIASQKKKCLPRHIDIEELRSAAYLGLVEAASRFDATKGVAFSTFAYPRIWGAIIDHLRQFSMHMVSLDSQSEDDGSLAETVAAPTAPADKEEVLEVVSSGLGDQAKEVLRMYFCDGVQMKEVGRRLGVTESRVSQLLTGYKKSIREQWTISELREELAA